MGNCNNCSGSGAKGAGELQEKICIEFGDLEAAVFLKRPNRFLVHCILEETGQAVEAHLADPGRLVELLKPGARLYLRFAPKKERKTKWSVVLVQAENSLNEGDSVLVSLQSTLANQLAAQALQQKGIAQLAEWNFLRSEYSYSNSRWDFLLANAQGEQLLLEVKSCSLVQEGIAMFPDAVTARGRRHLQELTRLQQQGLFQTAVLFVVQRPDSLRFQPADQIDPAFGQALRSAHAQGVKILVWDCLPSLAGVSWGKNLPADLF